MNIGYLDTPEEWRDFFIMCFTVAGTIVFLLMIVFTIVIGFLSTTTLLRARRLLKAVQPTLENVRETTSTIRTTVAFVSDTAVKPVVTTYGAIAGARRFVAVVSGITKPKHGG